MADFLLRFDKVQWALVTAITEEKLLLSLRSQSKAQQAAEVMRKMLRRLGEGGGHKAKAGGYIDITKKTPAEIEKLRQLLWRRYCDALGLKPRQGPEAGPVGANACVCTACSVGASARVRPSVRLAEIPEAKTSFARVQDALSCPTIRATQ